MLHSPFKGEKKITSDYVREEKEKVITRVAFTKNLRKYHDENYDNLFNIFKKRKHIEIELNKSLINKCR